MTARYTVDDLLRLRASPLVYKPDGLPPTEEWMGPTPENTGQRKLPQPRGRGDDGQIQGEISSRRPSGLDRKISTATDDLVLGPPKTTFASATRTFSKTAQTSDKPNEGGDAYSGPNYNFRDKFFKDRDVPSSEGDTKDTKFGGRRGGREDRDDWQNGRRTRNAEQEEADYRSRRNGDRDRDTGRWGGKDSRDQLEDNRRGVSDRDEGRFGTRRDTQSRAKFDRPWTRGDNAQDIGEEEGKAKQRDWRKDRSSIQAGDREWTKPSRIEQDPEWMDSLEPEEPKSKHTAQDFEAWKAAMNAKKHVQTPVEDKSSVPVAGLSKEEQKAELKRENGETGKAHTPITVDSSIDGFFGLFNQKRTVSDKVTKTEGQSKVESQQTKASKSRFANLFSPDAEVSKSEAEPKPSSPPLPTPQVPERPVSESADQEGFQRILQMLGTARTPSQPQLTNQARPPPPRETEQARGPPSLSSPSRESFPKHDPGMGYEDSPRNRNSAGLESLLGSKSPRDMPPQPREGSSDRDNADFLLRLMQRSRITPQSTSEAPQNAAGHTPGILQMPPSMGRPPGLQPRESGQRQFFDDPAIANMRRPEPNEPREGLRRRPTNGPPLGFFEEPFFQEHQQNRGNPSNGPLGHGHPLGVARPPGFDQIPPPGWPNHQIPQPPHQQQGLGPLNPPPGIPNPPPRGMNLNFNQVPMPHNIGLPPNERQQQVPRGQGMPNFPPGMPPPGYMNMNGPPPGFPPMNHGPDVMGMGPGPGFGGGNAMPPRHLMELFGANEQSGGRGGGGMPGPYR